MKKNEIVMVVLTVVAFVVAYLIYPALPERAASHWNAAGEVNGYMSRFWAVMILPLIMVIFSLMFILIPRIDPLKKNIAQFRKYFDWFVFFMMLFLVYIYALTIFWNFGWRFNFAVAITPAFAVLFYVCGIMVGKTKRNFFIGIRTPWTLSNDVVSPPRRETFQNRRHLIFSGDFLRQTCYLLCLVSGNRCCPNFPCLFLCCLSVGSKIVLLSDFRINQTRMYSKKPRPCERGRGRMLITFSSHRTLSVIVQEILILPIRGGVTNLCVRLYRYIGPLSQTTSLSRQ